MAWCVPLIFACVLIGVGVLTLARCLSWPRCNGVPAIIAVALPVCLLVIGKRFPITFPNEYLVFGLLYFIPVSQTVLINWKCLKSRSYGMATVDLIAFILASQLGRLYYLSLV